MKNHKTNTLVLVIWVDIQQDPKWQSNESAGELPLDTVCCSVGFVLKKDSEFLYLSTTISDGERDKTTIPLGCIKACYPVLNCEMLKALVENVRINIAKKIRGRRQSRHTHV